MTRMMIRSYRPRFDLPQIIRLIREELAPLSANPVSRDSVSRRHLAARLNRGAVFVAARSKTASPDGFIHVMNVKDVLQIDMLAVNPESRGRKLGARLLLQAERQGLSWGCRIARLYVDEANHRAQRFYARSGYAISLYMPGLRCFEMMKPLYAHQNPYGLPYGP